MPDVMTRNVVAVAPHDPLPQALDLLRRHHVKALPVTDAARKVLGMVTQTDLLEKAVWRGKGPSLTFENRLRLTLTRVRAPHGAVEDIMTSPVATVGLDAPIGEVALRMSASRLNHLPVVDDRGRLEGVVCQITLMAALMADAAEAAA
ncbi:hypothetical protein GCM10008174_34990 [Methylopila turkensis]|uniref:CBS domain-containing protein n=1 Tax=Methylopila turkensis TaxID=1437816 RepID=A0A9W6JUN1_9HYPH|nr:hypothetical protein GCM10008174_34990 [Methylopila turkensis]